MVTPRLVLRARGDPRAPHAECRLLATWRRRRHRREGDGRASGPAPRTRTDRGGAAFALASPLGRRPHRSGGQQLGVAPSEPSWRQRERPANIAAEDATTSRADVGGGPVASGATGPPTGRGTPPPSGFGAGLPGSGPNNGVNSTRYEARGAGSSVSPGASLASRSRC